MSQAAEAGDWPAVEQMIGQAQARFGQHDWLRDVMTSIVGIAMNRERRRMMKESLYSTNSLRYRLTRKEELIPRAEQNQEAHEQAEQPGPSEPSFLRRKRMQGKGDA